MITQVNCKICWFCVALFEGTSPLKMPQLWWSVWARKNWAALTHVLFQYWSLMWRMYIPVLQKYLHLFSLSKQKSFVDLLKLAVTGKFGSIFLTSFGKNKWAEHKSITFTGWYRRACLELLYLYISGQTPWYVICHEPACKVIIIVYLFTFWRRRTRSRQISVIDSYLFYS